MKSVPDDVLQFNPGLRTIRWLAEWSAANPARVIVRPEPQTALQAYLARNWPRRPATFARPWVPLSHYGEN